MNQRRFLQGLLLALVPGFFVSMGCTTVASKVREITKVECRDLDWFELGRTDGGLGLPNHNHSTHARTCVQESLNQSQLDHYANGYQAGLSDYCTSMRGFEEAKVGSAPSPVCPWPLNDRYMVGFQLGQKIHLLQQEQGQLNLRLGKLLGPGYLEGIDSEVQQLRSRKSQISAEINNLENELTSTLL